PDLVGRAQRSRNDERAAVLLLRPRGPSRLRDAPVGARDPGAGVRGMSARWYELSSHATDLPVLLPAASRLAQTAAAERIAGAFRLRLRPAHGMALLVLFIAGCGWAQAQVQPGQPSILETLWKWTPVLLRGFVFNLVISAVAMAAGTIVGLFLGFAQISLLLPVRKGAWLTTHFFRNAPWLVLLFYCMFLLPLRG